MRGHAQDVQVAVADLEREQDVEPAQCRRTVDVEEADREHAGGLRAQELSPAGVGVARRRRWNPVALEDPPDRRGVYGVGDGRGIGLVYAVVLAVVGLTLAGIGTTVLSRFDTDVPDSLPDDLVGV